MKAVLPALLLSAVAAPAAAESGAATPALKPPAEAAKPEAKKKDDFDLAQVLAMFDKIFPAQPDPPAARLALARSTAAGVLPDGTYARLFEEFLSGTIDRVLAINPADFGAKAGTGKAAATSLREQIAKDDPHFDERMRITRRVIGEELVKISALMEPRLREGLARSIARRFDEKQLADINAFLATDSGRAFGAQTTRMWFDGDVMRSMMQSLPHMITAMPGAMVRLEAETAHLPKPKAKQKAEPEKAKP